MLYVKMSMDSVDGIFTTYKKAERYGGNQWGDTVVRWPNTFKEYLEALELHLGTRHIADAGTELKELRKFKKDTEALIKATQNESNNSR